MKEDLRLLKGMASKEKIIQAAMELIAKEGMVGLSAKKIADASGLSKSNIFHHYPSVDSILDALFEEMLQNLVTPILSYEGKTLDGFLKDLGESICNISEEERLVYKALFGYYNACLYNEAYQSRLMKAKSEMLDAIVLQLKKYSSKEEELLHKVAHMIIVVLDGYALHFLLDSDEAAFQDMWALQWALWYSLLM